MIIQKKKREISIFMILVMLVLCVFPTQNVSAAEKTKLNITKTTIVKGQSVKLQVVGKQKGVAWKSSNKKIATVTKNGKVLAKAPGKAIITAKVGNKSLKCKVTVVKYGLNKKNVTLQEGQKVKLKLLNANKKVKWSSSNKKVAKVSSKGTVSAVSAGKAKIYAKMAGKTYKCSITVEKKAASSQDNSNQNEEKKPSSDQKEESVKPVDPGKPEEPKEDDKPAAQENRVDVVYKDGVITDDLKDQTDYTILDAGQNDCYVIMPFNEVTQQIEINQIITLPKKDGSPYALLKVTEISNSEDDRLMLHCVTPDLTEVFDKVDIYQDRQISFADIDFNEDLVSDITIKSNDEEIVAETKKIEVDDQDIPMAKETAVIDLGKKNLGKYGEISGQIEMAAPVLHVNADIDLYGMVPDIHALEATVTEKVISTVDLTFDTNDDFQNIYLAHMRTPIDEAGLFYIDLTLYLNVSANGEVKIVNETSYTGGFKYDEKEEDLKEINQFNTTFEGTEAQVHGELIINPEVRLSCLSVWDEKDRQVDGVEILGFEVGAGIGMDGYAKVYMEEPYSCVDLHIYPLFNLGLIEGYGLQKIVGFTNGLLGTKFQTYWTILDADSKSPLEKTWHWEDMVRVTECTRSDDETGGSVSDNTTVSDNTVDLSEMQEGEQAELLEDTFYFFVEDKPKIEKENYFTLQVAGKVILDASYSGANPYWDLVDENGNRIEFENSTTGIVHDSLYIEAGSYCFRYGISPFSLEDGSEGTFTLTYESTGITIPSAGNMDEAKELKPIAWNEPVKSQFSANRRTLYYRVYLPESGKLHISGRDYKDSGSFDIYDENECDIGVNGNMSSDGYEQWFDLAAGDYYIAFDGDPDQFNFAMDYKKSGETFTEPNNTIAEAKSLPAVAYDQSINGQIAYNDGKDYYKIVVPKAGTLYISLASQSKATIGAELYDEDGEQYDLSGESSNYLDETKSVVAYMKVTPGVYYMLCDGENGNYSFKLHLK